MRRTHSGFTTVELIVVLVLLGVLAAYAAPKFSGRGGYSELTAQQDLKQSIRFAQQLAMSRTDHVIKLVTVTNTTPNKIDVLQDGGSIGGGANDVYPKYMASDVTVDSHTLTFDRYGSAGNAATIFTITGPAQSLTVMVEGATGYAH